MRHIVKGKFQFQISADKKTPQTAFWETIQFTTKFKP